MQRHNHNVDTSSCDIVHTRESNIDNADEQGRRYFTSVERMMHIGCVAFIVFSVSMAIGLAMNAWISGRYSGAICFGGLVCVIAAIATIASAMTGGACMFDLISNSCLYCKAPLPRPRDPAGHGALGARRG